MTVGVEDIQVPPAKKQILVDSDAQVADVEKQFRRGLITEEERYQEIVKIWQTATKQTTEAVQRAT